MFLSNSLFLLYFNVFDIVSCLKSKINLSLKYLLISYFIFSMTFELEK